MISRPHISKQGLLWLSVLAILVLTRLLDSLTPKPTYAQLYVSLGQKYELESKLNLAIQCYRKGIFHNPGNIYPYYYAGLLLGRMGDQKGKIENLQKVVDLGPDQGKIAELTRLINTFKDEEYSEANLLLGKDLYIKNHLQEALPYLERSIKYNSGQEKAYLYQALVFYHLKNFSSMLATLELIDKYQFIAIFDEVSRNISPEGQKPLNLAELKKFYSH